MNYDKEQLKSLIGKSISSIVFHYWDDDGFKSLDWITLTIDGRFITYTYGSFAEDIVVHFDYSAKEIEKEIKKTSTKDSPVNLLSKKLDNAAINDVEIKRFLFIEDLFSEYSTCSYIFLGNGKVIEIYSGGDCVDLKVNESFIEII